MMELVAQGLVIGAVVMLTAHVVATALVMVADALGLVYSPAREARRWARDLSTVPFGTVPVVASSGHVADDRFAEAILRALRATAPHQSPIADRIADHARWRYLIAEVQAR